MSATRTPERAEFLANVITTAVEGGINYWAQVNTYRWFFPDIDGGTAEPGPDNTPNVTVSVVEKDEDMESRVYTITLDDIASAFGRLRKGAVEGLHDEVRQHFLSQYSLCEDADLDAGDCDAILQIACFGSVVYG